MSCLSTIVLPFHEKYCAVHWLGGIQLLALRHTQTVLHPTPSCDPHKGIQAPGKDAAVSCYLDIIAPGEVGCDATKCCG